jgi:hypothetical protein
MEFAGATLQGRAQAVEESLALRVSDLRKAKQAQLNAWVWIFSHVSA